jgi:hypothetical protein
LSKDFVTHSVLCPDIPQFGAGTAVALKDESFAYEEVILMMLKECKTLVVGIFAVTVLLLPIPAAIAAQVTGAIFTTLFDGSAVDYNIYDSKEDVYLNGGPRSPKSPCTAAGLPDGIYYFQVTDPSGKIVLSADPPEERKVLVYGGYITEYLGKYHATNVGMKCNNRTVTVELYPFYDTPNPGGEYKVWMAPANADGSFAGFAASMSKTDNFKAPGDDEGDFDQDGLTNGAELGLGTNPYEPDTDLDGFTDKQEVDADTDPLDASRHPKTQVEVA